MEYLIDKVTQSARVVSMNLLVMKSKPIYRREQHIKPNMATLNRLSENYERMGLVAFSNEKLMLDAPDMVSYSDAPVQEITVPYGWEEQRFAFDIISIAEDEHSIYKTIIKGYTDKYDITFNNTISPDTMFFVDSVINTSISKDPLTGFHGEERLLSTYSVMTDPITGMPSLTYEIGSTSNNLVTMRPEDVIMKISASQITEGSDVPITVLNNIGTTANEAKSKDLNPINNISEVLTSVAKSDNDVDFHTSESDNMLNSMAYVHEYRVDDQPFFKKLSMITHETRTAQFSFKELCDAFGDVSSVTTLQRMSGGTFTTDGDSAGEISVFASMANMFLDASMSYIRRNSIVDMSFNITNMTLDGSIHAILLAPPASDINFPDIMRRAENALDNIKQHVFPMISQNKYAVAIEAIVTRTDARISLEFNGRPAERFSFPLLAYSLASPVVGSTQEYNNLSNAIGALNDMVSNTRVDNNNDRIIY